MITSSLNHFDQVSLGLGKHCRFFYMRQKSWGAEIIHGKGFSDPNTLYVLRSTPDELICKILWHHIWYFCNASCSYDEGWEHVKNILDFCEKSYQIGRRNKHHFRFGCASRWLFFSLTILKRSNNIITQWFLYYLVIFV